MPEGLPLVLSLLLIGIVVLLVLVARRPPASAAGRAGMASPATSLGMSIGMLLGGILGAIVWISTGEFVMWVVFVGGGLTVGLAIGTSMAARRS